MLKGKYLLPCRDDTLDALLGVQWFSMHHRNAIVTGAVMRGLLLRNCATKVMHTKCELLVVVTFLKQFRCYLFGRPFSVRMDHASFNWLLNFNEPEGMLTHWLSTLLTYDMLIVHHAGNKHGNADSLSRREGAMRALCKIGD